MFGCNPRASRPRGHYSAWYHGDGGKFSINCLLYRNYHVIFFSHPGLSIILLPVGLDVTLRDVLSIHHAILCIWTALLSQTYYSASLAGSLLMCSQKVTGRLHVFMPLILQGGERDLLTGPR